MKPATCRRHFIWQSVVCTLVVLFAISYAVVLARQPLDAAALQIAAQALHSYAAEGVMLSEQALSSNAFSQYIKAQSQFLRDKVDDIAHELSHREIFAPLSDNARQALAAAHAIRTELHALDPDRSDPMDLAQLAGRLRKLSADMDSLAKHMER